MNAATIKTYDEMIDALRDAEADDSVRVVVLTGAGRAFCAGDDVKEIFLNPEFRDAKPAQRNTRRGMARASSGRARLARHLSEADHRVGQRRRRRLRMRHRADVRHARVFRPGALRRSFHSPRTDSRSGRTAHTAAPRRTRTRVRIDPERRHYRRGRGRANRNGEQGRAARAARRSDRSVREKDRGASPTRAASREGSICESD